MILPDKGKYPITQRFNDPCCRASYAQFGMSGHNGIDVGTPTGVPLYAPISGTAQVLNDPGGFGNYVKISNSKFASVVVAHLSKFSIANNTQVVEGQTQIGLSGASGNVTGPHYHFGVKPVGYNNSNGFYGAVDPTPYLTATPVAGGTAMFNADQVRFLASKAGINLTAAQVTESTKKPAYDVALNFILTLRNQKNAEYRALLTSAQAIADVLGITHDADHVDQKAVLDAVTALKNQGGGEYTPVGQLYVKK